MRNILSLVVAFTLVMVVAGRLPVQAAEPLIAGHSTILATQTRAFAKLAKHYPMAGSQQSALQAQMLDLARERNRLFTQIIDDDPAAVLRVAIPSEVYDLLPPALQQEIEHRAVVEGVLQVLWEDYPDRHVLRHVLTTETGSLDLHFQSSPPELSSGTRVRARGLVLGGHRSMVIEASASGLELLAADGTGTPGIAELSNTFGEQSTAVLLVNFPGQQSEPWTVEEARNLVFNAPSNFITAASSGQTWLAGNVFGWLTIPVDAASCDTVTISYQARKAALVAGIDLSGYSRLIYAFPDIGCAWSGMASVGGSPSEAWFDGSLAANGVVAHEIGHNFGLSHSHALECGSQTLGSSCGSIEYGDVVDLMGDTKAGEFTAFQKQRLGWLDFGNSPSTTTVVSSGSYFIEPYAAEGNGSKALKVPQGIDPVTGQDRFFYVEYRQAVGGDSSLASSPAAASTLNGLVVHLGTPGDRKSSYLLDMTPGSQTLDWNDPALGIGKSYRDPSSGVTITTDQLSANGAQVRIDFAQAACLPAAPQIVLAPAQGPWVPSGTAVNFDATIINSDSTACSSTAFDLTAALPAGWTATIDRPQLTLAPGASESTFLTVTSPAAAADGFYDFSVNAAHNSNPALYRTATATYAVSSPSANQAPVAVDDAATTAQGVTVTIPVLANDSDPDGDPLNVVTVTSASGGSVTINANGSLDYTPKRRFTGVDTFLYTLSDGMATTSATVTVTVGSSSDSPTKGGKPRNK